MTTSRQDFAIWRLGRSQTLRIKIASCLGIEAFDFNLEKSEYNLVIKSSKPIHSVLLHQEMFQAIKELYDLQQKYPTENL